ncbi:MarR family transcriptional regulator [Pseudonocardia sp.]|uniref:MarR family winged helix-turn-helix transcriptional regulator n=1 Tax=Pseudonocardia sp. TaxID=60912 RepID=UPI002D93F61E|nr:MarR family transcriptional regulator [Pseudonocardia sp.]
MGEDDLVVADRIAQELGQLTRMVTSLRRHRGDIAVAHVLVQLAEQGPLRVSAIADAVGSDPSTVSRKATELVAAGLVERRPDPGDGRAHLLAVTEAGARCCEDGRRKRIELVSAVLSGWSDESRQRLAELLGRFADDVQELDRRVSRRSGGEN